MLRNFLKVAIRNASLSIVILLAFGTGHSQPPYHEKYRPQLHFSPKAHWMNDPNGMVF
jgi:fructan beta-fructosidase